MCHGQKKLARLPPCTLLRSLQPAFRGHCPIAPKQRNSRKCKQKCNLAVPACTFIEQQNSFNGSEPQTERLDRVACTDSSATGCPCHVQGSCKEFSRQICLRCSASQADPCSTSSSLCRGGPSYPAVSSSLPAVGMTLGPASKPSSSPSCALRSTCGICTGSRPVTSARGAQDEPEASGRPPRLLPCSRPWPPRMSKQALQTRWQLRGHKCTEPLPRRAAKSQSDGATGFVLSLGPIREQLKEDPAIPSVAMMCWADELLYMYTTLC